MLKCTNIKNTYSYFTCPLNCWQIDKKTALHMGFVNFFCVAAMHGDTLISNRVLNKTVSVNFLTMSHSFFIVIIPQVLKVYFAWKQLRADYSEKCLKWKEENCQQRPVLFFSLVGYISKHINYWKLQFYWCKSSKVGKKIVFDPTFGVVILEIFGTFCHNNYDNYDFIADSQCDCYIFYVNESIQFCMISGETLPFKTDFNHTWRHN